MAAPVWKLTVDLETRTATFTTGLGEAARSARSAFNEIKQGAGEMGEGVSKGSLDVRHALGLVDNTIRGAHSMAMVDLIRMFQDSAVVMTALPFAMTAAGFALVAGIVVEVSQKIRELKEEAEKTKDSQTQFGTTIADTLTGLKKKLIEAEKETDELNKNHLGALRRQIELINLSSLDDLRHSFESISKAADQLFANLKTSWYAQGIGAAGAQHALAEFKTQYDSLLSQDKGNEASGLLTGTLKQARTVLELQKKAQEDAQTWRSSTYGGGGSDAYRDYQQTINQLKAYGVGITDKEITSQHALIDALEAQVRVQAMVKETTGRETGNASRATHQGIDEKHGDAVLKYNQAIKRMMDEDDKSSVEGLQARERAMIEATTSGSAERLGAITASMREEEEYGRQGTEFYKRLYGERVQLIAEMAQQEARLKDEAAKEQARHEEQLGALSIQAARQAFLLADSDKRVNIQRQAAEETQLANDQYQMKMSALAREVSGLDNSGKDYENKLKELQNKEQELTRQHEIELTSIKEKAEIERNQRILAASNQFEDSIARGLTQSIMGHQTWSKMLLSLGDEVVSGMIKNTILMLAQQDTQRLSDARTAASNTYSAVSAIPVVGPFLAPEAATGAFAAVLAFRGGTDGVPGLGRGDIVPAMLEPGEGVVPGGVMDGLRNVARNGGFDGGPRYHVTTHVHMHASALDSDGMDTVLKKHAGKLQRHFESTLRKMNR